VPMLNIFGLITAAGILYLWLRGHWYGWVLAALLIAWLVQRFAFAGDADIGDIIARTIIVFVVTGLPCLLWGSAAQWQRAI
jgi:hypothetical protein